MGGRFIRWSKRREKIFDSADAGANIPGKPDAVI